MYKLDRLTSDSISFIHTHIKYSNNPKVLELLSTLIQNIYNTKVLEFLDYYRL